MKVYIICLVLSLATVKAAHHRRAIDLVLEALNEEQWSQQEQACFKQTTFILNNAKNYTVWAMWIWNSMQHPAGIFYGAPYSLGHYDQCLEAPTKAVDVTTQYCLADVKLTSKVHPWESRSVMGDTESFLGTRNHMNRDLSKVTWGVCLPAECKSGAAAKILKSIYKVSPLIAMGPSIQIGHCQVAGVKNEFSTGFYAFVAFVLALTATTLFSTFYGKISNPDSATTQILQCFCLRRNWISLIKEPPNDNISSMNIIKVLLATGAIYMHSIYFRISGPIDNVFYVDEITTSKILKNGSLVLDIFFAMAGILLIKGLMTSNKHPLVSLVNRYFRLIGTFALVTFYVAVASIHMGDGPLWQKLAGREQQASLDSWPWSLLMLNNFINSDNITQIVAWHIPCDYQLAIMGTLIFMLWKKNYRLGKIVTIIVFVLAVLTPAVVTYWKKLPGSVLIDDIGEVSDLRTNEVYLEIHIKSYHRAVGYLIGMGVGYIIAAYKPEKYRNRLPMTLSLFMLVTVFVTMFRMLSAEECNKNDRLATAVRVSYEKIFASLATCTWIAAVEYGSIPYLRAITKCHTITVLSRLTYGIYLTHSLFLEQHAFSRRYIQQLELVTEIPYVIGVTFCTILASVILWLLVEAPLNNLVNYATTPRSSSMKVKSDDAPVITKSEEISFDKITLAELHKSEKLKGM